MTTTYTITTNEAFHSLEITFDGKPSEAVRDALKALRYRWHGVKKIWYGYSDEETVKNAIDNAENAPVKAEKATSAPVKVAKVNKYGVEVGDVFEASWGYDQTNVDFFQVVALVGETSVRVVEVRPPMIREDAFAPMASDRTYNITGELLPPVKSFCIKDNIKGDLKRVKEWGKDCVAIKIDDVITAHKIAKGERTTYESWYH